MLNWVKFNPNDYHTIPEGHVHTRYTKKKNYLLYIPDGKGRFSIVYANQHSVRCFATPIQNVEWVDCPKYIAEINMPEGEKELLEQQREKRSTDIADSLEKQRQWELDVKNSEFSDLVISRGS